VKSGGVSEHLSRLAEAHAMQRVRNVVAEYATVQQQSTSDAMRRKHVAVQVCSALRHVGLLEVPVWRDQRDPFRMPKTLLVDIAPLALSRDEVVRGSLHTFLTQLGATLRRVQQ